MHTGIRCDPVECARRSTGTDQEIDEMSLYGIVMFPAWLLCTSQSSSPGSWQHSKTKCDYWACSSVTKAFPDLLYHSLMVFILYLTWIMTPILIVLKGEWGSLYGHFSFYSCRHWHNLSVEEHFFSKIHVVKMGPCYFDFQSYCFISRTNAHFRSC